MNDLRTDLPHKLIKPKILYRSHIKKKLEEMSEVPLFFIVSGMGFGKTTAVRNFIRKKRNIKYIWFMFERLNSEEIWEWVRFCRTLEQTNSELSRKMLKYGLPHGERDLDRLVSMIESYIEVETFVIIDDLHLCKSDYIFGLIERIALRNIKGLHFVCISREMPARDVSDLIKDGRLKVMTQRNFEFSKLEMADFFILNDDPLREDEVETLYEKTKGWTSALYLAFIYHKAYGSFDNMGSGAEIMKSAVYDNFNDSGKTILLKLARMRTFTMDQAEYVTQEHSVREIVKMLYDANCFTKYDEESGAYGFHSMLRDLLDDELKKSSLDEKQIYHRIGTWHMMMGNRIAAIRAFARCNENMRILEIMSDRYAVSLMNFAPGIISEAFEKMDLKTKLGNPIAYLTFIYSYSLNVDMQRGLQMLEVAKGYYQDMGDRLADRNQILGEIALIESIGAFNDLKKMFECYERANEYFDGGTSRIFDADVIITFGVPLTISLYHREKGDIRRLVQLVEKEFWIFNHIANGCGAGFELHMMAECEYMAGNLEAAEMLAYKAIFKAQTRDQIGIILSISFTLLRIAIFNGKVHEIDDLMTKLVQVVEKNGNPIFLSCYEIISGYMYAYMGRREFVPKWMLKADPSQTKLMSPGKDSGKLISSKVAMELGEYERLKDFSKQQLAVAIKGHKAIGIMVYNMYVAIGSYMTGDKKTARKYMIEALSYAEADNCYVIMSENVYTVAPLMEEIGTPLALKTLALSKKYENTKRYYRNETTRMVTLTKRECEVMDLVCEGYTADAIAKILFVSHSTVKKHMSSAYAKLNVNKKADAIAIYKDMKS